MQVTIFDHKGFIHSLSLVISLPKRQKDKKNPKFMIDRKSCKDKKQHKNHKIKLTVALGVIH